MKPKTYNIEELRCNAFTRAGKTFDIIRYEDFMEETNGFAFPHRHNYYMILVTTKGQGSQLIDFKSYPIEAGMVFLLYPGMIHAWEKDEGLKGYLVFFTPEFFTLRFNDNNLSQFPFFNSSYSTPFVQFPDVSMNDTAHYLEQMLVEYRRNDDNMISALRSYLNILLIQCSRIYKIQKPVETEEQQNEKMVVHHFEQLIDRHFKSKKLVKDYAQILHLTPNYLNIICKETLNKSAGEIIRDRVMLEAKRMLAHEEMTVAEIGYGLNFKDNAYFCRFFKKYAGISPDKFRKQVFSKH